MKILLAGPQNYCPNRSLRPLTAEPSNQNPRPTFLSSLGIPLFISELTYFYKTFIDDTILKKFFGVLFDAASACTVFLSHFMLPEILNNCT